MITKVCEKVWKEGGNEAEQRERKVPGSYSKIRKKEKVEMAKSKYRGTCSSDQARVGKEEWYRIKYRQKQITNNREKNQSKSRNRKMREETGEAERAGKGKLNGWMDYIAVTLKIMWLASC